MDVLEPRTASQSGSFKSRDLKMAIMGLPEEEYFAPGHRACAGCGAAIAMRLLTKAAGKNVILVESTGCIEVVSTPYPETAWRLPWIHGAFENAASIASGVESALKAKGRKDIKVIGFGGDGGTYDIGILGLSGAFERGHNIAFVCYDNEAYMNTGIQRSGATPFGASTTTSPSGKASIGKVQWKKDLVHMLVANGAKYAATASIAFPQDAFKKIQTAIKTEGPSFVNLYSPCVPGWKYEPSKTVEVAKLGVLTGAMPLFEVIEGKHKVTMPRDPEKLKPVEEYLNMQGRFRHLFKPKRDDKALEEIQKGVKDRLRLLLEYESKGL